MSQHPPHPLRAPCPASGKAFTLVEVVISLAIFGLVVISALGAILFSLKTINKSRLQAQVSQILINEMESMRMRTWSTRIIGDGSNLQNLLGIGSLGAAASYSGTPNMDAVVSRLSIPLEKLPTEVIRDVNLYKAGGSCPVGLSTMVESPFYPFAVYGVRSLPISNPPYPVARIGDEVLSNTKLRLRAGDDGYKCRRYISTFYDTATGGSAALVILHVSWTDSGGAYAKTFSTIIQSNGINNKIVRL